MAQMSRRTFLDGLAVTVAGTALAAPAKSYAQIVGANDRVNFATAGLNGRGRAHLSAIANNGKNARMTHFCDVDKNVLAKFAPEAQKTLGYAPTANQDFRKALESKDVDAITIATPDHWHTPMAVLGLKAGKHVYVEKPSSHNPREGELLVAAQKKYGKLVQVGDQQRSSPHTIKMVQEIHGGRIGRAYYAKTWYSNGRKSMGIGKPAAVPEWLDWDLGGGAGAAHGFRENRQPEKRPWADAQRQGGALKKGHEGGELCGGG